MATRTVVSLKRLHRDIIGRCYRENHISYANYGAKGIRVCDEWHDIDNFVSWALANNPEEGLDLLRKDTSKDYSPQNCYFGKYGKFYATGRVKKCNARFNAIIYKTLGINHKTQDPVYRIYTSMICRCNTPSSANYKNYGGRGIKVCDEWLGKYGFINFKCWSITSGYKKGLTLDRIDVNGNYEPNNCRWATSIEQANNKRTTVFVPFDDSKIPIAIFCRKYNIGRKKVVNMLKKGYNGNEILDRIK